MQSRLQHGDENEEKGASLSRSIPSMAAVYTTIGIGKRHTGQACVLGPLGTAANELKELWLRSLSESVASDAVDSGSSFLQGFEYSIFPLLGASQPLPPTEQYLRVQAAARFRSQEQGHVRNSKWYKKKEHLRRRPTCS
jgi:hypothetical protein